MSGDKTLYALAEENNRMLRALSRDLGLPPPPEFPKPQPDSSLESTAKALSEQRAEIARCIWSMLRVEKPQDPSLDAALDQLGTHLAKGGFAGATIALIQSKSRDAALEEAALRIQGARDWIVAAGFIRALKSKPATILDQSPGRELLHADTPIRVVSADTQATGRTLRYGGLPASVIRHVCRLTNVQNTVYVIDEKHLPPPEPIHDFG